MCPLTGHPESHTEAFFRHTEIYFFLHGGVEDWTWILCISHLCIHTSSVAQVLPIHCNGHSRSIDINLFECASFPSIETICVHWITDFWTEAIMDWIPDWKGNKFLVQFWKMCAQGQCFNRCALWQMSYLNSWRHCSASFYALETHKEYNYCTFLYFAFFLLHCVLGGGGGAECVLVCAGQGHISVR